MDIKQTYNEWLENAVEDKDLKAELESIKNNEDEIYDRFYTALKFGTASNPNRTPAICRRSFMSIVSTFVLSFRRGPKVRRGNLLEAL